MRTSLLIAVFALNAFAAWAQVNTNKLSFPVLITASRSYTNATIDRATALEAIVYFDGGIARVAMSNMPPAVQRQYNYSPETAQRLAAEQTAKAAAEKLKREQSHQAARALLQKAMHNALVTVEHDKFLKVTSFDTSKIPLSSSISLHAFCATNKEFPLPDKIFFKIQSESESWRFLNYRNLIVLYDGKTKDCGPMEHNGSVLTGEVLEQMDTELSLQDFTEIADAKTVEMRVGIREFSLSYKDREPLQALADRFRDRITNSAPIAAAAK